MFHYISCGLDFIWLKNGFSTTQTDYGEATSIHDLKGLHKAIGLYLVNNVAKFTGAEIRFLRKELDLAQVDLANVLKVSEATVRNWENDRAGISGPADGLLRVLYEQNVNGNKEINEILERISKLNRDIHQSRILLEETNQGWKQAA